ncbi:MAG: hypothetical protein K9G76_06045 [Bacteroidales bacterium]|nr:hypothetical protein [Bacteroidales bacterium]MCF8402410.1 hypothetical protein [Bacteroidales bacterium]
MFKKDHYLFGLAIGILVPVLLFGIIYLINFLILQTGITKTNLDLQSHVLISLFGNLFPIRYYFVNLKFEKTGRGVLLVTFAFVLVSFAFKDILFQ